MILAGFDKLMDQIQYNKENPKKIHHTIIGKEAEDEKENFKNASRTAFVKNQRR